MLHHECLCYLRNNSSYLLIYDPWSIFILYSLSLGVTRCLMFLVFWAYTGCKFYTSYRASVLLGGRYPRNNATCHVYYYQIKNPMTDFCLLFCTSRHFWLDHVVVIYAKACRIGNTNTAVICDISVYWCTLQSSWTQCIWYGDGWLFFCIYKVKVQLFRWYHDEIPCPYSEILSEHSGILMFPNSCISSGIGQLSWWKCMSLFGNFGGDFWNVFPNSSGIVRAGIVYILAGSGVPDAAPWQIAKVSRFARDSERAHTYLSTWFI